MVDKRTLKFVLQQSAALINQVRSNSLTWKNLSSQKSCSSVETPQSLLQNEPSLQLWFICSICSKHSSFIPNILHHSAQAPLCLQAGVCVLVCTLQRLPAAPPLVRISSILIHSLAFCSVCWFVFPPDCDPHSYFLNKQSTRLRADRPAHNKATFISSVSLDVSAPWRQTDRLFVTPATSLAHFVYSTCEEIGECHRFS